MSCEKWDKTRAEITIVKGSYSSEVSRGICNITESKKTLNFVSDTNAERKRDGTGLFSTYCYSETGQLPIDENRYDTGLMKNNKYYPYDPAVAILVGTADKWPYRFKRPRQLKKKNSCKTEEDSQTGSKFFGRKKNEKYSFKSAISKFKNIFT